MMKTVLKNKPRVIALILAMTMIAALFGCGNNAVKEEKGELINASPSSGEVVTILPESLRTFYANYENPKSVDPFVTGLDIYQPVPVKISWTCEQDADYYIVGLSMKKNIEISGSEDTTYFVTVDNFVEAYELFAGKTYYYRVFAVKGTDVLASVLFSFKTENYIRTVYVDGVSNTRDLGGKVGEGGRKIKQGIIYRGAAVDSVTKQGKVDFLEKLGIKTEIDLRTGTELSVFRKDINVISVLAPCYVNNGMGIDLPEYQVGLAEEIRAFANPDNFPIYFHCAIGRDRTGTLAFFIQVIAGVSEEEIIKDYLTSFFSVSGTADDPATPSNYVGNLTVMINWLKEQYKGNLKQSVERFLIDIGITKEEIKAIRANILEG